MALLIAVPVFAASSAYVVVATPIECRPGLYHQPGGGPFSVFLFCDDALGVNMGVVNSSGGAGPGPIELGPTREWSKWKVNDRFWQESAWATDITSLAWSPDLKSLYVGTQEVYGTGALYKLDLVNRTFRTLIPKPEWQLGPRAGYSTKITSMDQRTGNVSVEFTLFDEASNGTTVRRLIIQ